MPTNKNALIRYKYLDKLLSDYHHFYDIHDLTEKVNDMLYEDGFPEVTQRCIEKDINTLEYKGTYARHHEYQREETLLHRTVGTEDGQVLNALRRRTFSLPLI